VNEDESIEASVLIVSYNCFPDLERCVASLRKHLPPKGWEILVRDNGSRDAQELRVLEGPDLRVVYGSENLGFGRANNELAQQARGKFLICLNPDTILKDSCLVDLPAHLDRHPECGACGPLLEYPDGALQDCWGEPTDLWWDLCEAHYLQGGYRRRAWVRKWQNPQGPWKVGFTSGACLCLSASLWKKLGGYDPGFFLNHEDVELCDRVRKAGFEVHVLPAKRVVHAEGVTQRTNWRRYTFHRQQGKWIYQTRRYSGAALLVAKLIWWESILLKLVTGSAFLRGPARSRLHGFTDAMKWVVAS
jgi:GT2 family glycosyltransferase